MGDNIYRQATITVLYRGDGEEHLPFEPNILAALNALDMALHALNLAGAGYPVGIQGQGPYGAVQTAMRVVLTERFGTDLAERIMFIRTDSGEDVAYCIEYAQDEAARLAAEEN